VLGAVLVALDVRMQDAGGWGIVDFELAGSKHDARDMLADWGDKGRDAARLSLWLDYPYLLAYGAFWALAVAAVRDVARRRRWLRLAAAGAALVAFPIAAAALDAFEDVWLLLALGRHGGGVAPALAAISATGKFILIYMAVGYVSIVLVARAYQRWRLGTRLAFAALALSGVALVVNAIVTSAETEPADAGAPGQIIHLPGGDLHVIDEGPRDESALVLIHGYTASANWWERDARILAPTRRVIRVDLLGHGASEKPKRGYGMEQQARRVLSAVRGLGVRRALVVGHSMGGVVAVAAAEADRALVRGVMVLDTPPDDSREKGPGLLRFAWTPGIGQALHRFAPDSAVKRTLESAAFAGEVELPDRWVEDARGVTYTAFIQSGKGANDYRDERPLDERMAATGRPLFVLFGEKDNTLNPQAAFDWDVPGVKVVRIPGVGHTPQYERPRETAELIARFARQIL
jgi:pimeloyl-ACP methyl ester carboxylesterase